MKLSILFLLGLTTINATKTVTVEIDDKAIASVAKKSVQWIQAESLTDDAIKIQKQLNI